MSYLKALPVLALALLTPVAGLSESHMDKAISDAIDARKAQMDLYAFNLGLLGGMAKGAIDYDAAAAGKAASNLAMLTKLDQSRLWPEGSDEMSTEGTRALADIWDNLPDVMSKNAALVEAATAMEAAAGSSLAELQAAMGPLGGACGACHKAYRAPEK